VGFTGKKDPPSPRRVNSRSHDFACQNPVAQWQHGRARIFGRIHNTDGRHSAGQEADESPVEMRGVTRLKLKMRVHVCQAGNQVFFPAINSGGSGWHTHLTGRSECDDPAMLHQHRLVSQYPFRIHRYNRHIDECSHARWGPRHWSACRGSRGLGAGDNGRN
jgi:hypothetical protein